MKSKDFENWIQIWDDESESSLLTMDSALFIKSWSKLMKEDTKVSLKKRAETENFISIQYSILNVNGVETLSRLNFGADPVNIKLCYTGEHAKESIKRLKTG